MKSEFLRLEPGILVAESSIHVKSGMFWLQNWASKKVSFTDYDLDVEHFAGVLSYDPPHDTSVATWALLGRLGIFSGENEEDTQQKGGFH